MEPRRPKHKQAPPLVVATDELERALQNPATYRFASPESAAAAFPDGRGDVDDDVLDVIHTHLSMVFMLPRRVYKVKKPVDFGFVDFSTLYKRFQACYAEVQLNARLAPDVYVGVVPISMKRESREVIVRCDDFWSVEKNNQLDYWLNDEFGEIVEWAVHMVRLPDDRTLLYLMDNGRLTASVLADVAIKLVEFHANARRSPKIDEFGKEAIIRHNIDENFEQTTPHIGVTVSESVYKRVKEQSYEQLKELEHTISARVSNGYICDSHGDLRLEHIYLLPSNTDGRGRGAGDKFVILDCIEFNEQFRYGDPLSDVAFVMMDIWRKGRPDLARLLMNEYLKRASQDSPECKRLFTFYAAYRAVVRAKVHGFRVVDPTVSAAERDRELQTSRCYWLVALELLSPPAVRPCLILVGGLPASGKSSLAKMLAGDETKMAWLRADEIRKELAKQLADSDAPRERSDEESNPELSPPQTPAANFEEGLYSPHMTKRTYDEMMARCVSHLREGERVVVDATFRDPELRRNFVAMAHREGALFALLLCECDREIIKGRLIARKDDVSDATWEVYERMEQSWRVPSKDEMPESAVVNTEKEKELTLRRAQGLLRKLELL